MCEATIHSGVHKSRTSMNTNQECYKSFEYTCVMTVTVHLHKESEKIRIKRGVRQGDTISPKLFTATLESIFRRLNWENKGMKIDGEFLSNLHFADDIFLCIETPRTTTDATRTIR